MERKFPVRNFLKFGYTSRGCPLFRRFREMLFHSSLEISGNSNQNFLRMESARSIPKFSKISDREFPFHLIFLPEFPEFSVEWFAFRKFNNFRIFRKYFQEISLPFYQSHARRLSKEIPLPFASVSKIPEFLVDGKPPLIQNLKFPNQLRRNGKLLRKPRRLNAPKVFVLYILKLQLSNHKKKLKQDKNEKENTRACCTLE